MHTMPLAIALLVLAFPPTSKPADKLVVLARAMIEVRRLCLTLQTPDSNAREIIDRSGKLDGKFSCYIDVDKIEQGANGINITGRVEIDYQDRDRYRTSDERREIAAASALIKQIKLELETAIQELKEQYGGEPPHGPYGEFKPAPTGKPSLRLRQMIRDAKQNYEPKILDATKARDALVARISKAESGRRDLVEKVPCSLLVNNRITKKLDMEKFLKKKKVKLTARVEEYKLGVEPPEIGGHIYVSSLSLNALSISKTVVKKPAYAPDKSGANPKYSWPP